MDIYVAGKTDDWERVRRIQEVCVRVGHAITYDWTKVVEELGTDAGLDPKDDLFRRECARNDVIGVREADMLIACVDYPGLCGTLIEVGMALGAEIPVVTIGQPERNSVFFALEGVTQLKDEFQLIDFLPVAV